MPSPPPEYNADVTHNHMPEEARPAKWLKIYAWIGMLFLAITTIFYLIWRFSA